MNEDTEPTDPTMTVDLVANTEEFVEGLQEARDELQKTREAAQALAEALEDVDEAGNIDVEINPNDVLGTASKDQFN